VPPTSIRISLTAPQTVIDTSAELWSPRRDGGGMGVVLAHGAGESLHSPVHRFDSGRRLQGVSR